MIYCLFVVFQQKTAYEMRIREWRSTCALPISRTAGRNKPHGVMAVLGPYNFPAHLPNGHIIPALMASNAVVFKPSEKTPAVGEMLVDLYHSAGVPDDLVRLIVGGPAEGRALPAHEQGDGVLFTVSAPHGNASHTNRAANPAQNKALEIG